MRDAIVLTAIFGWITIYTLILVNVAKQTAKAPTTAKHEKEQ